MKSRYNIRVISANSESIFRELRWSKYGGKVTCPHCGCSEVYHLKDGRYKCRHCRKIFSDKTGTILQNSKLSTTCWMIALFKFAACTECSAIDLMKEIGVNYKTAYSMLQKIRYSLLSSLDTDLSSLEGLIKIDEAYIGAEWKNVHLRKKMTYMKKNGYLDSDDRYTKHSLLQAVSAKKCHILSIADDKRTVLLHCPNPITKETIKSVIDRCSNVTGLISDESKLYNKDYLGIEVYQSNHSGHTFITENGYSSNVCENRFSWSKRKLEGVYTHCSEKYLQLYLNQRQWSFNNKGVSTDDRFRRLVLCCLNYVTLNDIRHFDYRDRFVPSKRVKEQEMADEFASLNPFVKSVVGHYKTYNYDSRTE